MATMQTLQSAFLKGEDTEHRYSRDSITVVSGQNLARGTVLGKITANGKYTAFAPAAADGSQTAAGVLLDAVDASAADKEGVAIVRDAIVATAALVFAGTPTQPQKDAAIATLKTLGVVARSAV